MNIHNAIALYEALGEAIDAAQKSGADTVDLTATFAAADDTARAELDAAIKAAAPTPLLDN